MRFLLDTNIISNIIKPTPSPSLLEWMGAQNDSDLYISTLTIAEIRRGLLDMPAGKKHEQLDLWFSGPQGPSSLFAGRILHFDEKAALVWARLMADGRRSGRPKSALDMMVAAIGEVNGCVIVTDNERDFDGVEFFNPMQLSPVASPPPKVGTTAKAGSATP